MPGTFRKTLTGKDNHRITMAYFTQMSQTSKDTAKQALRALVALVFIVAIVWVAMQSFRVLPGVKQFFANAFVSVESFFSPAERITLRVVDSQVVVDTPFTLTWEHAGRKGDGSYIMSYECREDLYLARVGSGDSESTLFCNTDIPLLHSDTTLSLVAHGDLEGVEQVPFTVRFSRNGTSVVTEEGTINILVQDSRFNAGTSTTATSTDATGDNDDDEDDDTAPSSGTGSTGGTGTVKPRPGTPTYTTVPVVTQPQSDPNGQADLVVRVIAVGLVDRNDGDFSERDEIPEDLPSGRRAAIKFEIENRGTKKTGDDWNFTVKLPTSPSFTYTSPSQPDLYPGDKVEYIIGFDKLVNRDEANYTIEVDPRDEVDESNERNNDITREIEIDRD